jgi:hypothetical protein
MADVHNRSRYLAGCRCDRCRKANSDYKKQLRLSKAAEQLAPVRTLRQAAQAEQPDSEHGPAVTGVLAEISDLPAFANRQGLVQIALSLARVLDTPSAVAQWPSAAHRLSETLDKLRKGASSKTSRLASVQAMTGTRVG